MNPYHSKLACVHCDKQIYAVPLQRQFPGATLDEIMRLGAN